MPYILRQPSEKHVWVIARHDGTWQLAIVNGQRYHDSLAFIGRNKNGTHFWKIHNTPFQGVDPSRYEAQKSIMDIFERSKHENQSRRTIEEP
jgi:hypothetical protein